MRSRSRVRTQRANRGRGFRLAIESLEGRVVLSAMPPAWVSIGPAPITDPNRQNINYDGNYVSPPETTGAIQAVATYTAPGGKQGAYIGGALGGVWQTPDLLSGTPAWSTHTDRMPSLAIDTIAVSPLDTAGATVYAGTGPTSNGGVYWKGYGAYPDLSSLDTGLYLSTDAGQTWTALNDSGSPVYGTFISKVLPTSIGTSTADQTVLVGTEKGLFVSADGGRTFAAQTFTNPVLDVIADPLKAGRFYLLAGPDGSGNGAGVYRSDDAGKSWTSINGGAIDSTVIGLIPKNGEFNGAGRLAATTEGGQTLLYMTFLRNDNQNTYGVFRTAIGTDGSSTWGLYYGFGNDEGGGGGNNLAFAIDPSNPDIVYTGGYGGNSTYRLAPDSNQVVQKTELTHEGDGSLYDIRAMAFATDAKGHEVLVLTSDSGVYGLTDPSTASTLPTWKSLIGNISVNESYTVAATAGPFGQLQVGGGSQDTTTFVSTISSAGQTAWIATNSGDGYGSAFDPAAGMFYATSDNLSDIQVAQAGTGKVEPVSFAGWASADKDQGAFPSLVAVTSSDVGGTFNPKPVVFAGYGLYEAQPASLTSGTVTVTQINAPDQNDTYSALSFGGNYQGAADPYVLYAARGDGTLWFSDALGAQATKLTGWTHGTIVGLQQDPSDSHHVYALTKSALYVSTDAGQSWTPYATQPTKLGSFLGLGLVPTTVGGAPTNLLLVGGVGGAEALPDEPSLASNAWSPIGSNLPNTLVTSFAYVPGLDDLVLSTFGRGDWLLGNASKSLLYPLAGQTTTTLATPTTTTWGQPAELTAQVTPLAPGEPAPTGTVSFSAVIHGTTVVLGSATLSAGGDASLFLPGGLPLGALTLVARYSGDASYSASEGQATATIAATSTEIGLVAPTMQPANVPVTLSAQVTAFSGGITPTGIVSFFDGGTLLGTASLRGGVASLSVPPLSVGTHPLMATFTPAIGGEFTDSQTIVPVDMTVEAVGTEVGLVAPASVLAGVPVALTATVAAPSGGILAGTVSFYDGTKLLGSAPVNAARLARLTVPSLSVGTHSLTASFQPRAGSGFLPSPLSEPVTVAIHAAPAPPQPVATSTALAATPLVLRRQVRFGVQVNSGPGASASGLVELLAGGQVVAIGSLNASGAASFTLPVAQVLNRPVAAVYVGGAKGSIPALGSHSAPFTPTSRWFRSPFQAAVLRYRSRVRG